MNTYRLSIILGFLAGLIYNIWPLGYIMNPSVARVGLASDLQASGQPYNWFFIAGDVACFLFILALVAVLVKHARSNKSFAGGLYGLAAFGIFTTVSALIPLNCQGDIRQCGYEPRQPLGWHDIAGGLAALGLFLAMVYGLRIFKSGQRLWQATLALLVVWGLWGLWFMYATLYGNFQHPAIKNLVVPSQQVFVILTGLAVWLVAYGFGKISRTLETV